MMRGLTDQPPMSVLIEAAAAAEREGMPCVTVFTGFPLADTEETGLSVVATADQDVERAEAVADELVALAWSMRDEFVTAQEPVGDALERAAAVPDGPVILADLSDNCHSGGTMDSMAVIAAALDRGLTGILAGPVADGEAVARMIEAGVGATVSLDIGGKSDTSNLPEPLRPLRLSGTVRTIGLGRFTVEGPIFTGMPVDLGRCAVLESERMTLLVSEGRVEALDPLQYRIFGLEPTRFRYVILKSKTNHRPAFLPLAKANIECNGPGVGSLDLSSFRWRRVRRPVFPLDRMNA